MRIKSVEITALAVVTTPAFAQDLPNITCFDSQHMTCDCPCTNEPLITSKTFALFIPPIEECIGSGSYASAGVYGVYDCDNSHAPPEIGSYTCGCTDPSTTCNSLACSYASGHSNYVAGACASTSVSEMVIQSFVDKPGSSDCYLAESAYAYASAWIQPNDKGDGPREVCINFDTPANPDEITLHARLTECGCDWVISTPNGDRFTSGVAVRQTSQNPDPDPYNHWQICCLLPDINSPFSINTFDVPLSAWDINQDGRFNQDDVRVILPTIQAAAQSCLSSVLADCVPMAYDLDGDGDVDSYDITFFWNLIDCGIDTGYFGDFDQDGDIDCDDYDAGRMFLNAQTGSQFTPIPITDPLYIFELDQNLDGLIDINDVNAFLALFPTCP